MTPNDSWYKNNPQKIKRNTDGKYTVTLLFGPQINL